jgi:hypothetical protein
MPRVDIPKGVTAEQFASDLSDALLFLGGNPTRVGSAVTAKSGPITKALGKLFPYLQGTQAKEFKSLSKEVLAKGWAAGTRSGEPVEGEESRTLDDALFSEYLRQKQRGEQDYIPEIEDWMRNNAHIIEQLQSGEIDPNFEIDLSNPGPWLRGL